MRVSQGTFWACAQPMTRAVAMKRILPLTKPIPKMIPASVNKLMLNMTNANSRIHFGLQIVFVCLYNTPSSHYHNCANLSEDIELIKCLSGTFCQIVNKIEHILSVIHYTIYGTVCFQFTHFPFDDWDNLCFVVLLASNRTYELSSIVKG